MPNVLKTFGHINGYVGALILIFNFIAYLMFGSLPADESTDDFLAMLHNPFVLALGVSTAILFITSGLFIGREWRRGYSLAVIACFSQVVYLLAYNLAILVVAHRMGGEYAPESFFSGITITTYILSFVGSFITSPVSIYTLVLFIILMKHPPGTWNREDAPVRLDEDA